MKTSIVNQLRDVNPIERFRDKQGLSQKDFAAQLGYSSAGVYRHHCNTFSSAILVAIRDKYGVDLYDDAIRHLRSRLKAVNPGQGIAKAKTGGVDHSDSYADMVG